MSKRIQALRRRPLVAFVSLLFGALCIVQTLGPASASAQTTPGGTPTVKIGEEYYEQSRFDEAIALLQDLVDRNALSGADLQKARELLARSYVKKQYPDKARTVFKSILAGNEDWRPDPIRVPPDEMEVFEAALSEYRAEKSRPGAGSDIGIPPAASGSSKPFYKRWYTWAGVAGVTVAAILIAGGGDDGGGETNLPPFPGPPSSPARR